MVDIVATMGPDDTNTWREIVVDCEALLHANPVSLEEARAVQRRRLEFIRRAYEVYDLEPGTTYRFCPFTGAITED